MAEGAGQGTEPSPSYSWKIKENAPLPRSILSEERQSFTENISKCYTFPLTKAPTEGKMKEKVNKIIKL